MLFILNFYDLRTFDAKFCRENLRTFSADYFGLKSKIRRHFYFLDVCTIHGLFSVNILNLNLQIQFSWDWKCILISGQITEGEEDPAGESQGESKSKKIKDLTKLIKDMNLKIDNTFHICRRGLSIWDGIRNWVRNGLKLRIRAWLRRSPGLQITPLSERNTVDKIAETQLKSIFCGIARNCKMLRFWQSSSRIWITRKKYLLQDYNIDLHCHVLLCQHKTVDSEVLIVAIDVNIQHIHWFLGSAIANSRYISCHHSMYSCQRRF